MNRIALLIAAVAMTAAVVGAGTVSANENVTLTVTVTDDDGNAVGDALVTVSWDGGERTDETRSNGQLLVDVPSGADVSVAVEHDELVMNNPTEVGTVTDHTTVTADLYPEVGGEITVEDETPIVDATVTLTKDDDTRPAVTGTTDADGVFLFDGIEAGSYDIDVEKRGYYDESATVDLRTTDEATVALEPGTERVSFAVIDGYLEQPLQTDVTILKDGSRDATLSTNEDGERSILLQANRAYVAVIEADGYDAELEFAVGESARDVEYVVERAPAVTLETSNDRVLVEETVGVDVTDEYGEAVAGAELSVDGTPVATTAEDGSATVPIETHGELEITAQTDDATASAVVSGVDPDAENDSATQEQSEIENETTAASSESSPGLGGIAAGVAIAVVLGFLIAGRR